MKKTYYIQPGHVPGLYYDMLQQPHALIAGASGSGKSTVLNGLISCILRSAPTEKQIVLIDPKRVELSKYKNVQHTIAHATEPDDIIFVLQSCVDRMEKRYKEMQKAGITQSEKSHIYIVIDELADLMTTSKKQVLPILCRLAQLGRAANIHLILATQRPTSDVINGQIKVNIDCRLALRSPTAQDSRNIINQKGAELLPKYGQGYYLTPDHMPPLRVIVPRIDDGVINDLIWSWTPGGQRYLKRAYKKHGF